MVTISLNVDDLWKTSDSDYGITVQNNFSPIPIAVGNAIAKAPGVTVAGSVRAGEGRAYGKTIGVTAVDPGVAEVMSGKWKKGSQSVIATLGADGAFVDDSYAKDHHLDLGSPVESITEIPPGDYFVQAMVNLSSAAEADVIGTSWTGLVRTLYFIFPRGIISPMVADL